MHIPLKAIHYFAATVRLGGFSQAAQSLHVTHGAVFAQVSKLEEWLGVSLFTRGKGRIFLNEEGKKFLAQVEPALLLIEKAVKDTKAEPRKKIIISTVPSLAVHLLLPNLQRFYQNNPEVDIELHYFLEGQYHPESHFVLGFCNNKAMIQDELILFSAASIPVVGSSLINGKPKKEYSPEEIFRYPLIHDGTRDDEWRDWYQTYGGKTQGEMKGTVYSDFNLLYTSVLNNAGAALCPYTLIYEQFKEKRLIPLSSKEGHKNRVYYLAKHKPCKESLCEAITCWITALASEKENMAKQWFAEYFAHKPFKTKIE